MSSVVKGKLKAAAIHFCGSTLVIVTVGLVVFFVWYPIPFSVIFDSVRLWFLIAIVEVLLGPFLSLVIFNPEKKKTELIIDYSVVISLQVSALLFGLYIACTARPLHIVFVKDRFEIVTVADLDKVDHRISLEERLFSSVSMKGIKSVSDGEELLRVLRSALSTGKDIHLMPEFYQDYIESDVYEQAHSILIPCEKGRFPEQICSSPEKFRWMPAVNDDQHWVAILEKGSSIPKCFIKMDPWDLLNQKS